MTRRDNWISQHSTDWTYPIVRTCSIDLNTDTDKIWTFRSAEVIFESENRIRIWMKIINLQFPPSLPSAISFCLIEGHMGAGGCPTRNWTKLEDVWEELAVYSRVHILRQKPMCASSLPLINPTCTSLVCGRKLERIHAEIGNPQRY